MATVCQCKAWAFLSKNDTIKLPENTFFAQLLSVFKYLEVFSCSRKVGIHVCALLKFFPPTWQLLHDDSMNFKSLYFYDSDMMFCAFIG